ncbi:unnamed protein product [Amoebophrya sp. A25]|nr:unnamed protein product [Amoebophrya sp. A25]|eukprot:GSA25T00007026001.1
MSALFPPDGGAAPAPSGGLSLFHTSNVVGGPQAFNILQPGTPGSVLLPGDGGGASSSSTATGTGTGGGAILEDDVVAYRDPTDLNLVVMQSGRRAPVIHPWLHTTQKRSGVIKKEIPAFPNGTSSSTASGKNASGGVRKQGKTKKKTLKKGQFLCLSAAAHLVKADFARVTIRQIVPIDLKRSDTSFDFELVAIDNRKAGLQALGVGGNSSSSTNTPTTSGGSSIGGAVNMQAAESLENKGKNSVFMGGEPGSLARLALRMVVSNAYSNRNAAAAAKAAGGMYNLGLPPVPPPPSQTQPIAIGAAGVVQLRSANWILQQPGAVARSATTTTGGTTSSSSSSTIPSSTSASTSTTMPLVQPPSARTATAPSGTGTAATTSAATTSGTATPSLPSKLLVADTVPLGPIRVPDTLHPHVGALEWIAGRPSWQPAGKDWQSASNHPNRDYFLQQLLLRGADVDKYINYDRQVWARTKAQMSSTTTLTTRQKIEDGGNGKGDGVDAVMNDVVAGTTATSLDGILSNSNGTVANGVPGTTAASSSSSLVPKQEHNPALLELAQLFAGKSPQQIEAVNQHQAKNRQYLYNMQMTGQLLQQGHLQGATTTSVGAAGASSSSSSSSTWPPGTGLPGAGLGQLPGNNTSTTLSLQAQQQHMLQLQQQQQAAQAAQLGYSAQYPMSLASAQKAQFMQGMPMGGGVQQPMGGGMLGGLALNPGILGGAAAGGASSSSAPNSARIQKKLFDKTAYGVSPELLKSRFSKHFVVSVPRIAPKHLRPEDLHFVDKDDKGQKIQTTASSQQLDVDDAASSVVSSRSGAAKSSTTGRGRPRGGGYVRKAGGGYLARPPSSAPSSGVGSNADRGVDTFYIVEAVTPEVKTQCMELHQAKPTFSEATEREYIKMRIFQDKAFSCKTWGMYDKKTGELCAAVTVRINECPPATQAEDEVMTVTQRSNKWETYPHSFRWVQIMNMSAKTEGKGHGTIFYKILEPRWKQEGYKIVVLFPADNDGAPRYWGNLGFKERSNGSILPQRARQTTLIAEIDVHTQRILPMWEKDLNLRTIPRRAANAGVANAGQLSFAQSAGIMNPAAGTMPSMDAGG